jgi:effector-binding domain-containing protein
MKILIKIIKIIVIIIVAIGLIGFFIPSDAYLERSITINASATSVFEEVNDVEKINPWAPWQRIDPDGTTYVFTGSTTGLGRKMSWESDHPDVGTGSQEIILLEENKKVRTELYFGNMEGASYSDIILLQDGEQTKVTWTYEGDMGSNPFFHYFTLMMDSMIGPSYEDGLNMLKERVESKPKFTVDISITTQEAINYLAIQEVFSLEQMETIGPRMGEIYGQLINYIQKNGVMGMGQPMSIYNTVDDKKWDVNVAIPVADPGESNDENILVGQTIGGKMVKAIHMGDYANLSDTHKQLSTYIQFNSLTMNGKGYEIYVSDPAESDTALWQTEIYYPIK